MVGCLHQARKVANHIIIGLQKTQLFHASDTWTVRSNIAAVVLRRNVGNLLLVGGKLSQKVLVCFCIFSFKPNFCILFGNKVTEFIGCPYSTVRSSPLEILQAHNLRQRALPIESLHRIYVNQLALVLVNGNDNFAVSLSCHVLVECLAHSFGRKGVR